MTSLASKTALVTGGAKRLGRATALALAREGVNVVVHYGSSATDAECLVREIKDVDVRAWTVQGDLAKPEIAQGILDKAWSLAGEIDILVNNASIFPVNTFHDMSVEDIHTNVNLHALSPAFLARALHAKGGEGAIVNMLDCKIADYDKTHLAYHLSKKMLHSLTRIMAIELAPRFRVNAVAPGLVLPPEGKDETYLAGLASSNALNRYGHPDDVTAAILFLLKSDFVTGQTIYVDGGRNLRGNVYGL